MFHPQEFDPGTLECLRPYNPPLLLHISTKHGSLFWLSIYFPSHGKCMYFTTWKIKSRTSASAPSSQLNNHTVTSKQTDCLKSRLNTSRIIIFHVFVSICLFAHVMFVKRGRLITHKLCLYRLCRAYNFN